MGLPYRILLAKGIFHLGCFVGVIVLSWLHWAGLLAATLWLLGWRERWVLREMYLPLVFPSVHCAKCGDEIPLVQFWRIQDYKHHKQKHALSFHDRKGQEIGYFDCPREDCATINLQRGVQEQLNRGQIIGNSLRMRATEGRRTRFVLLRELLPFWKPSFHSSSFPIGYDPRKEYHGLRRLVRRVRNKWRTKRGKEELQMFPMEYVLDAVLCCHMLIVGKSGSGKTFLLKWMVTWIFTRPIGTTVIDKTGNLVATLLRLVPRTRMQDVLLIDATEKNSSIRMNVIAKTKGTASVRDRVVDVFATIFASSWGDNIEREMRKGIETVQHFDGTLKDLYDLFTRKSVRERMMEQLDDEVLLHFWKEVHRMRKPPLAANKLELIVTHPVLGRMLCSKESNFDAHDVIRERKIVLVNSYTGSDKINAALGTFILAALRDAAKDEHVRHITIIDEAGSYINPGMDIDAWFSELRQFGMTLVLACQYPGQLPGKDMKAALSNIGTTVSFAVAEDDGEKFARRMHGTTARDFMDQEPGECIVQIRNRVVPIRTLLPKVPDENLTNEIKERMRSLHKGDTAEENDDDDEDTQQPERKRRRTFALEDTDEPVELVAGVR